MQEQELNELSIPIWDKLRRAVEEGDKAQAKALIDEIQANVSKSRSDAASFVNMALAALAERSGEDAVKDVAGRWAHDTVWNIFFSRESFFCLMKIHPSFYSVVIEHCHGSFIYP